MHPVQQKDWTWTLPPPIIPIDVGSGVHAGLVTLAALGEGYRLSGVSSRKWKQDFVRVPDNDLEAPPFQQPNSERRACCNVAADEAGSGVTSHDAQPRWRARARPFLEFFSFLFLFLFSIYQIFFWEVVGFTEMCVGEPASWHLRGHRRLSPPPFPYGQPFFVFVFILPRPSYQANAHLRVAM
ncbi:hypothetical protein LY76DRAFT_410821 [Colletotrichum caudatum]|nr:hypothetical protein LY76DRAFT_410821 [Colletotrichum caudatum]